MQIVALAGGVGGAKLVDGLVQCLHHNELTVVVNTGDDFDHWGLRVCPDLDTICYTVAGLANQETGWGRRDETWNVLTEIARLKGQDWFRVGDRDLATHIERTERLAEGQTLSQITENFSREWGIYITILPMSDDPVATIVDTIEQGELAFQEYFVHQHCEPQVKGFKFAGVEYSRPAPGVLEAIGKADAIVFCPSNPWVSLDPILAVPGILSSIKRKKLVISISPIVAGKTIKGPAAKMFMELGIVPSALAVAEHYQGVITHFILDLVDRIIEPDLKNLGVETLSTNTIMETVEDRKHLALDVLNLIKRS
jgi:LPPG:FO 2-phospho-L-lactate transferase